MKTLIIFLPRKVVSFGASTLIWTEKLRSRTLDLKQMRSPKHDKARTPHIHAPVQKANGQLYRNGKTKRAIIDEYDLTPSSLDRWIHQDETSGSFKEKNNRSLEQQELLELRKELKQLRMENDMVDLPR